MAVTRSADPLLWVDCEMTGLDPDKDKILEVQCYITDASLNLIEPDGCHVFVLSPQTLLDSMNEWCKRTHSASGLTDKCRDDSVALPEAQAAQKIHKYVTAHLPKGKALLAGNSVHADKMFLMRNPWAPILQHLHYRILDVSALKESARRWCSDEVLQGIPPKQLSHTAEDDIKESIAEARYYMQLFGRLT